MPICVNQWLKPRFQAKNAIFTKNPHVISMSFDVVTMSFLCHLMSFACRFVSFACHLRSFAAAPRPPNETMNTKSIRPKSSIVNWKHVYQSASKGGLKNKKIGVIGEIGGFILVFKPKTPFSPKNPMSLAVSKCQ